MSNAAVFVAGLASIVLSGDKLRQIATVRVGDLKHPPDWIRVDSGGKEERIALGRSYQNRPNNLILISPDGTIRDGNRRVDAIIEDTGPDAQVQVCVTAEEITDAVSLEIMLETAEHTKALTSYEQYVGYTKWLEVTGKTARELAAKIHRSEGMVSNILSLSKCIPAVVEAAREGKIGPSDWATISRSPDQQVTLDLKLGGATREELNRRNKKPKPFATAVRAAKVKIPLRTEEVAGIVTVTGEGLDLDATEQILKAALKSVRAAKDKALDVKTAQAVWADMAAAN